MSLNIDNKKTIDRCSCIESTSNKDQLKNDLYYYQKCISKINQYHIGSFLTSRLSIPCTLNINKHTMFRYINKNNKIRRNIDHVLLYSSS
jgi:hypothetical protein